MSANMKVRQPKTAETHDPVTKTRKPVPEALDSDYEYVNEREELVEQFAPDCLNQKAGDGTEVRDSSKFCSFFGDPTIDTGIYKRQGYIPVMDETKNEQVTHRGDPLFKRARELFVKDRNIAGERSRRNVESTLEAEDEVSKNEAFTTAVPPGG